MTDPLGVIRNGVWYPVSGEDELRIRALIQPALAEIARLREGVVYDPETEWTGDTATRVPYEPVEAATLARTIAHILLIEADAHGMGACRLCQA